MSYVIAGSLAYWFVKTLHLSLGMSLLGAVLITVTLGILFWNLVFRPLQNRNASPIRLMIASIALFILIQNAWLLLAGNSRVFLSYDILDTPIRTLEPLTVSGIQLLTVPIAVLSVVAVEGLLRFTHIGRAMRAVSSYRVLAAEQGFNLNLTSTLAFGIGSLLAGMSGYLDLLDPSVGIDPIRGLRIAFFSTVACLIGGAHSLAATAFACVLLGIVRALSIWKSPNNWEEAVTAVLLIAFMSIKSAGLAGRKPRTERA
jgi:branched-chain amino acid transport system permease protein